MSIAPQASSRELQVKRRLRGRGGFVMLGHAARHEQLEQGEGDEADRGAGDMEQPEGRRVQGRIKLADLPDDLIRGEEGEVIEADDGGVDLAGRDLREKR